jgi:hypothetical protein
MLRIKLVRLIEMNTSTGTSMMNSASASTKGKRVVSKKTDDAVATGPSHPVTAPSPAVAVTTEAPAKRATKKAAATTPAAAAAPVAAPVATPAPAAAAEVAAPAAPATTLDEDLKGVLSSLTSLRESVSAMITEVKRLDKRVHREIKDARKRKRRVPKEGEEPAKPRGPSIFEIPTKVSDELCKFLGKPTGTLISRSNVTKEVNNYVKAHNLKNKHDIKPDAPLRKLLQVPETEQLTYFNLQRYLNRHYIKEPKA